jgi:hypothetical protein
VRGQQEGLCVLAPIVRGRGHELRELLQDLPRGPNSPLARVEATHFARWQVIELADKGGGRVRGEPRYLLFASEHDGEPEAYVQQLCGRLGEDAHTIWGHCAGYPGREPGALQQYLLRHRVRPGYSVVAFPGRTVAEVRAALAIRDRLIEFVVSTRDFDPPALKRAWEQRFRRER